MDLPCSETGHDPSAVYSISRLNREARTLLERGFGTLTLEGEISNLAIPSSGHLYFTLKDEQAQVRCAMFKGSQRNMDCRPENGLKVQVRARVTLYEGRGEFQLVVESLSATGEGALQRAFELLKRRLGEEGLFDVARKRRLPRLPRRIGLITSPTGAVVHDILSTLKRRFPAIGVILYPVVVQGAGAAEAIAAMIRRAGERNECDALILARGGGSLEDLRAFNEEVVARAIAACPLPLVSGVGHETDVTIADFVADVRAPTPTAAAELLSPDRRALLAEFAAFENDLVRRMRHRLDELRQTLDWLGSRIVHPRERLLRHLETLVALRDRLQRAGHLRVERARHRLSLATGKLETLSPLATLNRGYAIARDAAGHVIRVATALHPGDALSVQIAHGSLRATVTHIRHDD